MTHYLNWTILYDAIICYAWVESNKKKSYRLTKCIFNNVGRREKTGHICFIDTSKTFSFQWIRPKYSTSMEYSKIIIQILYIRETSLWWWKTRKIRILQNCCTWIGMALHSINRWWRAHIWSHRFEVWTNNQLSN